ncbi:MAG: hypothetical protein ACODAC_04565 [Pseudomonadota bacterium]
MQDMSGDFEHGGRRYSWWAGHSDRPSEWCVHCRDATYGVTRYLPGKPNQEEAGKVAQDLAPLVQELAGDPYTT